MKKRVEPKSPAAEKKLSIQSQAKKGPVSWFLGRRTIKKDVYIPESTDEMDLGYEAAFPVNSEHKK